MLLDLWHFLIHQWELKTCCYATMNCGDRRVQMPPPLPQFAVEPEIGLIPNERTIKLRLLVLLKFYSFPHAAETSMPKPSRYLKGARGGGSGKQHRGGRGGGRGRGRRLHPSWHGYVYEPGLGSFRESDDDLVDDFPVFGQFGAVDVSSDDSDQDFDRTLSLDSNCQKMDVDLNRRASQGSTESPVAIDSGAKRWSESNKRPKRLCAWCFSLACIRWWYGKPPV